MYEPQSKRRNPENDTTAPSAAAAITTTTAAAVAPNKNPRRRSTVDTPYNLDNMTSKQHPHSQSEPRKSWAETDWEELEKIWSRSQIVDEADDDDDDDLFLNLLLENSPRTTNTTGEGKRLNGKEEGENLGQGIPRVKAWRRRVTI